IARFNENARQPSYEQVHRALAERCGKARRWQPEQDHGVAAEGVFCFTLPRGTDAKTLSDLQKEVAQAGFHLVLAEPWDTGATADIVLYPTSDPFAVIAAVGTEGANYSIHN